MRWSKCHGASSRVGSGGLKKIAGRVGSGQEVVGLSWGELSDRVKRFKKDSRIESSRVKRWSKCHAASSRVGSGGFQVSRVGSGRARSPCSISDSARRIPTREKALKNEKPSLSGMICNSVSYKVVLRSARMSLGVSQPISSPLVRHNNHFPNP